MPEAGLQDASRRRTRLGVALFVALFVAPLVAIALVATRPFAPDGTVLEIEMRATGGTAAQLFWMTDGLFSEQHVTTLPLHTQPGEFERLRFPLPQRATDFIRYDFLNGPGEVVIRSMRILDDAGRTLRTIDPAVMISIYQVEGVSRVPGTTDVRVVTTRNADDPMLLLRPEWTTAPPSWHSLAFVTPFSLAWIAAACVAVIVAALVVVARDAAAGPFTLRHGVWLALLFVVVLAAKLALVDHYPMPVPFWDQWDGEAHALYLPYANHGLNWRVMFALHNEHRIFFSRVLALSLLALNGQWDPQLQILVNAGLHSLTAVVLATMLWIAAGRRWLAAIVAIIALAFAPPFALENTLAGFQSAFYFLVLFSMLALWLLGTHRAGSSAWFLGWLCAFCSIFTVAGGLLTVVAVGGLVVLLWLENPREWRGAAATLAALSTVAAVSYLALSPPLSYHAYLKAESTYAFALSLARNLSFPWITRPRPSVVLWLPLAIVAAGVVYRRFRARRLEQLSLALGAWVLMQAAAIAYSRGVGGTPPASRYLDVLSFGFIVNSVAILALIDWRAGRRWTLAMVAVFTLWIAAAGAGISGLSQSVLAKDGRERSTWMQEYVRNVRHFIISGDLATLSAKRGPMEVPYFNPAMLGGWLSHPYLRSILPAVIREPIALTAGAASGDPFVRTTSPKDLLPVWDSYGTARAKARGRFQSAPIRCGGFASIRFEVAGGLREAGNRLALRDAVDLSETPVRPPFGTGSGWIATSVRCPAHPFTVLAVDDSPTSWFAFRQPAAIARLSAVAERTIQQWRILAILGGVLLVFALAPPRRAATGAVQPELKR